MFTNILCLAVVLLELNCMNTGISQQSLKLLYSYLIRKNPLMLRGETEFCKSDNAYYWAAVCRQVLISLQDRKPYENIYLDYQSFTPAAAASKCQTRIVLIEDFEKYAFAESELHHHMAVCPVRAVIVLKYKKVNSKNYTDIIAITPIPDLEGSVLVFEKNEAIQKYVPLTMYENLHYSKVPEELFTQEPPISTMYKKDLVSAFNELDSDLKTGTSENEMSNIIDKLDSYMFARLCLMISKSKQNVMNLANLDQLCKKKPYGMYLKVNTSHIIRTPFINNLLIYPCSPPEKFIRPDSEDALQKWQELKTLFALSRGPNDKSLIMYRYKYETIDSIKFKPVELIENVSEEFIREIRIPTEFKEKCEPPIISEQVQCDSLE